MTIDDLRAWLTTCEWQSRFDDRTLARARDYARRRHVVERHIADADASSCVLSGMVAGGGSLPYQVTIAIQRNGDQLLLDAVCSCPVGTDCKHAATLMFELLDGTSPATGPSVTRGSMVRGTPGSFLAMAPRIPSR